MYGPAIREIARPTLTGIFEEGEKELLFLLLKLHRLLRRNQKVHLSQLKRTFIFPPPPLSRLMLINMRGTKIRSLKKKEEEGGRKRKMGCGVRTALGSPLSMTVDQQDTKSCNNALLKTHKKSLFFLPPRYSNQSQNSNQPPLVTALASKVSRWRGGGEG